VVTITILNRIIHYQFEVIADKTVGQQVLDSTASLIKASETLTAVLMVESSSVSKSVAIIAQKVVLYNSFLTTTLH
jgi:hypothetical protein